MLSFKIFTYLVQLNLWHSLNVTRLMSCFSYSSFLQACTTLTPDDQLHILKNAWAKEKTNTVINEKDERIIKYYLTEVRFPLLIDYS